MIRHSSFVICHSLLLLACASIAHAADPTQKSLDELLAQALPNKEFREGRGGDFDRIPLLREVSPELNNKIAAAAARELALKIPAGDAITKETVDVDIYQHPQKDTPTQAALRKLHYDNDRRVGLLRDMSNLQLVSTPEVIEPLINMLEYPGKKTSIRSMAAQVLSQLTGRSYANYYQLVDEVEGRPNPNHPKFVAWWRDWWKQNKDKHPVFDAEVEKMILARLTAIENHLRNDLEADYPELKYLNPERLRMTHIDADHLIDAIADSSVTAEGSVRRGPDGPRIAKKADWISLKISAQFATPFVLPPREENYHSRVTAEKHELLHETLPGTDILITITAASEDAAFLKQLRASLAKLPPLR